MELQIQERLLLLGLLPREGDYVGLRELRRAKENLSLTPDEWKEFDARYEDGKLFWNQEKAGGYLADIPLTEYVTGLIQEELRTKNKQKKLQENELSLYVKFVVDYDQV